MAEKSSYNTAEPPAQATPEQLKKWKAAKKTAAAGRTAAARPAAVVRSAGGRTPHARLSDLPAPAGGFLAAVADYQAAKKCGLDAAMRQVARVNPQAHRAFIMARNGGRLPAGYYEQREVKREANQTT